MRAAKEINVSIVGPLQTGKSTLFCKLTNRPVTEQYEPTIGANFSSKILDNKLHINYWDISGGNRYRKYLHMYIRKCRYVLVVFSKYDKNSFTELNSLIQVVKQNAKDAKILLIGNEYCHLPENQRIKIQDTEIDSFCDEQEIPKESYLSISDDSATAAEHIFSHIISLEDEVTAQNTFNYSEKTNATLKKLLAYNNPITSELHTHIGKFYTDESYRKRLLNNGTPLSKDIQTQQLIQNLQSQSMLVSFLNFITSLILLSVCLPFTFLYISICQQDNIFKRNQKAKGSALMFFDFAPKQQGQVAVHEADLDYANWHENHYA